MIKNCLYCDKPFDAKGYATRKKYCSDKCARLYVNGPKKANKPFKPNNEVIPSIIEFASRMERQNYMCGLKEINELITVFFMLSDGKDPYSLDTTSESLSNMWRDIKLYYEEHKNDIIVPIAPVEKKQFVYKETVREKSGSIFINYNNCNKSLLQWAKKYDVSKKYLYDLYYSDGDKNVQRVIDFFESIDKMKAP